MKINRKTPRAVVYGPKEYGGIEYPYIGTIQSKRGIAFFVKQIQWGEELGTDLRITLSQAQLQSGLTEHILEKPCDNLNIILEKGQIQHIHDRLNDLGGGIWIENAWKPNLQRVGDKLIMKVFLSTRGKVKK